MLKYTLRRFLISLPVIFGVVSLTFLLIHFIPGDPIDIMLGDSASSINKDSLRSDLGLDLPLKQQYVDYLFRLLHFDLSKSLHSHSSVSSVISERFPATLELTLASILLSLIIGIPLGIYSALKQYKFEDNFIMLSSLVGMSIPGFFLGPVLIWIFAIKFNLFPVSERGGLEHLVLPALSLALPLSAILLRVTRASMLEVIKEDYIRCAKSKGISDFKVYFKHALANALIPIITTVGLQIGALLTGTVITETIFDWPGIGTLLFSSIQHRDYPLIQGCILIIALIYVFVNFITDITYAFANPKVRMELD